MKNLKILSFYSNYLTTLPSTIGQLSNLETLDCQFNKLTKFSTEIPTLPSLIKLNLNGNELRDLCGMPQELPQLHELHLRSNKLQSLIGIPANLPNLHTLFLYDNQLETLEYFPSCPKLIDFDLNNNPLNSLYGLPLNQFSSMVHTLLQSTGFRHPVRLNLSEKGHALLDQCTRPESIEFHENAYNQLHQFYKKSSLMLCEKWIEGENLTNEEQDRIAYEGGSKERQLLEKILSTDHYVLRQIDDRLKLSLNADYRILR